jgi:hypothetical protein
LRRLTAAGRVLAGAHRAERRRALAMRAAFGLPYETLLAHTPDPFGALADGDYDPLLRALFDDAGLRPPSGVAHSPTTSSGATSSRSPR